MDKRGFHGPKPANRPTNSVESLSGLLPQVAQALRLDERAGELALLRLWPTVLQAEGLEAYLEQSWPLGVQALSGLKEAPSNKAESQTLQKTMVVAVTSPMVVSNLQFSSLALLNRLNAYSPQTGVVLKSLRFKVVSQKPEAPL